MEPEEKKSNGALIGSIVIIIILIIGGVYIWQSKIQKALDDKAKSEDVVVPADDTELSDLEQDLSGLDTNVDVDVDTIN